MSTCENERESFSARSVFGQTLQAEVAVQIIIIRNSEL